MFKFKTKLLCNEEEFCCTKTELLNFEIILSFPKLDITGARLKSEDFILVISVDIKYFYAMWVILTLVKKLKKIINLVNCKLHSTPTKYIQSG